MTPEQFAVRANAEKLLKDNLAASGTQPTLETLYLSVLTAVQLAHILKVSEKDFVNAMGIEWKLWDAYEKTKQLIEQKRANKGGK